MEPVDLYQIYRLVSQRARRAKDEGDKALALEAKSIARRLIDDPTITNLTAFRLAERRWLFSSGRHGNADSMYSAFKAAIESGTYVNNRPVFRNAALGDDPENGFVYCVSSSDYPGYVKIGYTRNAPEQRLRRLRLKQQLTDAKLEYVMAVDHPARIERLVHAYFNTSRLSPGEEWFAQRARMAGWTIALAARRLKLNVQYVRTFGQFMGGQQYFEQRD